MKKVLFVTTSDLTGSSGNNVATKEMVTAFAQHNSVLVSVACPAPLGNLSEEIKEAVTKFHFVIPQSDKSISNHLKTQLNMFLKIGSLLRHEDFDLLVIRHASVMIAPTLLSKIFRIPYVLLARGLSHEELRFSRVLKKIFWVNVRLAEDVYCAYSEVVDRVKMIRPSSMPDPVLFPNAVDPAKFNSINRLEARKNLSIEYASSEFVIGFVGSLKPYHMIQKLIEASVSLPEDVRLLIIGDGPERQALERLVKELNLSDRVTFTGVIPHPKVDEYIAVCDVMYGVIDPGHPGNAIKCYEYLACGRPIIVDDRTEFEFVDEVNAGIVLDEVTVEEIMSAIQEFESMPPEKRLKMGEQGREYVLDNHTWDALADFVVKRNL